MLVTALVGAQEQRSDYVVQVPLTLSGEGPWYRLELPMALHFAGRFGDLRDLRVFNAEGEAQAYALTLGSAQHSETRTETAVKWFPLHSQADAAQAVPSIRVRRNTSGTLVEVAPEGASVNAEEVLRGWLLDASAIKAPLYKLILDWSAERDGFQRFSIEASDDLQHWQAWGDGQIARLAFADERIDQREVSLPGQRARYLRLLWLAPQQAPALTAARLLSASSSSAPAPMAWSAALAPSDVKAGEYTWNLPLALPLERVRVELKQSNTLAPVILSGRRDGKVQWQPLARGLLYRLPQNGKEVIQNELELPAQRVQQLRLQVDERGGGLGSAAPQLTVGLRATQVVFLARGTPPYTLAIGNAAAQAANLPLTTLIPGYDDERLAKLGVAQAAAEPQVEAAVESSAVQAASFDWKRLGLWAVLLLGVALLVLMAWSLLRAPAVKP
ncbi:DUF3999 domain-containing protein [Pseudomonas cavernicola]|uniref:DUF3999 domain-containing protein n=2 Tax=Pseudomonas cavernicola TaxID=2320866 RepID=A0A418XPJ5_9PSED|nr:DUF3999 domain-containing protein [Pseudomonas cavernicola]RJG14365.1 DUF3999 domain-containing protein [Pseudomonas cavernicola]